MTDVILFAALGLSVASDLTKRRVFDAVTLPAMALALIFRSWSEGLGGLESGVVSGLVGMAAAAFFFGSFALTRMGVAFSDVKLAGVVGASLGFPLMLRAAFCISVVGALQAVVSLIWQRLSSGTLHRDGALARQIPYSIAIALGSVWAICWQRIGLS